MDKRLCGVFIGGAVIGVIATLVSRAGAGGMPTPKQLRYAGRLENADGTPLTGTPAIQISLWNEDKPDDNLPLCQVSMSKVPLDVGRFSIELPDACTEAIKEHANVQVEVRVEGAGLGKRKLGAVPYAIESAHTLESDHAAESKHALSADSASGELQTTIESLSRKTRVVAARDERPCFSVATPGTDLLKVDFTLSRDTAVHVTGDMIRHYMGRADLELVVDGTAQHWAIAHTETANWMTAHVAWTGILPAGDHFAALRGREKTPDVNNIWGCGPTHGGMSVLIFE